MPFGVQLPAGWESIWPCYSCCRRLWIPELATFGRGCPGVVAYIPVWTALLVLLCRYGLRPLWRRRPLWLRNFAAEEEADAEKSRKHAALTSSSSASSSTLLTAAADDEGNEADEVESGFEFPSKLRARPWHLFAIVLFCFSLAGAVSCVLLAYAFGFGPLFLMPLVPSLICCLTICIDRPRSTPGPVLLLQSVVLVVQLALLLAVPELIRWPFNLPWIAEMVVPLASLGVVLAMPMRDPLLGDDGISSPFDTPSSLNRSPEDNMTLWHWLTVSWMGPLIATGAVRQLHDEDVWSLPLEFQHDRLHRLFRDVRGSVTARILKANAPDLVVTSSLGVLESVLAMLPIVLLKQLLSALEGPDPNVRVAIAYAVLTCVSNLVRAQSGIFQLWFSRRCYERSRGEMITMVYEKTLRRKAFTFPSQARAGEEKDKKKAAAADGPASMGKILNLMRNDVYEVAQRFWEFPTLFTKPLNFVLSLILLWKILGAASLLGILVVVLAQVINYFVVRWLIRWEMARRAVTDLKLQVTSQFIEAIRHLRWYDWQDKWLGDILSARNTELRYRVITNLIQRLINVVNQTAAAFFPVAAFYAYTVVAKRPLTIEVAFPALNLFNLLEQSLRELPDLITVLLNASVAMRRIEGFMAEPDKDEQKGVLLGDEASLTPPGELRIEIKNASFSWPNQKARVLSHVTFIAEPGLTVVCGRVGTGKTALLQAILGELDQHDDGSARIVPSEMIGYCAQTPWLQSMSIRENILFCAPYDERRYRQVLDACCLLPDLAEFKAGDLSAIGENGIGLSGGQKARVALARAVYSRARVLLLDDPIAALDHNTAEAIMKKLFNTSGLMQGRLVVFVTHRMDLVTSFADRIYEVCEGGGDDVDGGSTVTPLAREELESNKDLLQLVSDSGANTNEEEQAAASLDAANDAIPDKFIEEEHRAHGGVMASVYWRYVRAGGLRWWATIVVCFVVFRVVKLAYFYFLKIWGEAYEHTSSSSSSSVAQGLMVAPGLSSQISSSGFGGDYYEMMAATTASNSTSSSFWDKIDLGLPAPDVDVRPWLFWLMVLSLLQLLFRTLSELLLIVLTYTAGKKVFEDAMDRVSKATFRFFDVTPVGRLMNRVTSDIGTVDGPIAAQIHRCTWFVLQWVAAIFVIASATPAFLALAVLMTSAFILIFVRFLPASQSLRRLEMVSLSPLMSNFGTLLEGLTTVRAFRAQPHFQDRIIATTDAFQKMDHFYWSLQGWLSYRFNALTALSTFALTLTAVGTGLSSGVVAFVLAAAANFVNATQILCRRYGELQMQFVSVERVMELLDLEPEPAGTRDPPAAWPTALDDVVFDRVTVRYAPHLEPSLREVSVRIPAGSTVAVTGRTGSGKSTLALALLGTVLPDSEGGRGGSIYIGGVDVATVNKHALRRRVSFVAQDPVLFPGSLRENLDPIGEHSDEECAAVLRRVLGDGSDFGIDSRVDAGGKNMSQGQRQLVGLGRAVLRRSPIVILDEATASIDKQTAFYIQEVLREELRQSTVITIAHRVEAVRDADFSLVLENGRVIHAGPVGGGGGGEAGAEQGEGDGEGEGEGANV